MERLHQRHVSRLRRRFPSRDYLSARFDRSPSFFAHADPIFFSIFPNAEPGLRLHERKIAKATLVSSRPRSPEGFPLAATNSNGMV